MAHARRLSVLSLAVACAILLCVAVTQSHASPTIPQIKAELKKCRAAMEKLSDYKAYLQGIDEMLKRSPADMKGLFNTTLLIPTNKGLYALGLRTLTNMTAMTVIGQYNVLTKRYTAAQLAKLASGAKIPSVLPGVPIQVYPKLQGSVTLGKVGAGPKARATIVTPDLCNGVFLKGHGMSLYLKPPGLHTPRFVGKRVASSGRAVAAAGAGGSSDRKNADVNKVAVLRELLTSPGIKCAPACHDGLSARLTEAAGFKLAFMSGFAVSATRAGLPDTGLLSYGEMVEAGRLIASAAPGIPVIGDGDTGYGNAVNVRRTVRGYREAGMAGIIIEDQAWPKACGHTAGRRVVGRDEAVMRIRAAADERDEGQGDIVIVARSDACQAVSLDEALWRAAAFADAGADMVFIDALGSEEDMRAFVRAVPNTPKLINQLEGGGRTPILSPQQLEDMGFAIAVYPLSLVGVCTRAMQDALSALASAVAGIDLAGLVERAAAHQQLIHPSPYLFCTTFPLRPIPPAVAGIDLAGLVERAAARAKSEGGGGGDDEVVVVDFKDKSTGDRVRILLE
ncbi:unnamed protein product [Closterium sp. Yama58-4]|nr:unnamed protein product [Closterium sp. Yama58-4]